MMTNQFILGHPILRQTPYCIGVELAKMVLQKRGFNEWWMVDDELSALFSKDASSIGTPINQPEAWRSQRVARKGWWELHLKSKRSAEEFLDQGAMQTLGPN